MPRKKIHNVVSPSKPVTSLDWGEIGATSTEAPLARSMWDFMDPPPSSMPEESGPMPISRPDSPQPNLNFKAPSLNSEEVDEEGPGPVIGKGDVSPTFSTFSLPSPPEHPRAWGPPPVNHAEELASPPDGAADNTRLGNYSKRRRELLDILNNLHSTGYFHLLFNYRCNIN
jgi:hypothetical protein